MCVSTTPEQMLSGHAVGVGEHVACSCCKRTVREAETVTVYAYRLPDEPTWNLARLYCRGCKRDEIEHPTLGASELLARARIVLTSDCRTQRSNPALADVEQVTYSGPDEGGVA